MLYLLDSSALINNSSFEFKIFERYRMTNLVFEELKDMRVKHIAENAISRGVLRIADPKKERIKEITERTRAEGFNKLSKADISLIALAAELKEEKKQFKVVTDDYSIQNFLKLFKIPYEGVEQNGIKKTISFSVQCKGCGKKFPPETNAKKCPDCGSKIMRLRKN